ncbi:MAG: hypothetical protein ACFE0Q_02520 [Anaerolineae bacterium]
MKKDNLESDAKYYLKPEYISYPAYKQLVNNCYLALSFGGQLCIHIRNQQYLGRYFYFLTFRLPWIGVRIERVNIVELTESLFDEGFYLERLQTKLYCRFTKCGISTDEYSLYLKICDALSYGPDLSSNKITHQKFKQ